MYLGVYTVLEVELLGYAVTVEHFEKLIAVCHNNCPILHPQQPVYEGSNFSTSSLIVTVHFLF